MERLHIAYASDTRYLSYLAVAAGSAALWASDPSRLVFDILTIDVNDDDWQHWIQFVASHLPQGVTIRQHKIDKENFNGLRQWHGSVANYARLLLPDILPEVEWCVYGDVDTLFTDDPLKLLEHRASGVSIRGHIEWMQKDMTEIETWFRERNQPYDQKKYVCSGFLLINLEWFRKTNGVRKTLDFLLKYPDAPLVDQEALNAVCCDTSLPLPYEWGVFGCEAFQNGRPSAIHYPGHNPWKLLDNMFFDYIDAYRIWFLCARRLYGLTWLDYCVNKNRLHYALMRSLGWSLSFAACVQWLVPWLKVPFVSRYLRRHYASLNTWNCMMRELKINKKRVAT